MGTAESGLCLCRKNDALIAKIRTRSLKGVDTAGNRMDVIIMLGETVIFLYLFPHDKAIQTHTKKKNVITNVDRLGLLSQI